MSQLTPVSFDNEFSNILVSNFAENFKGEGIGTIVS